MKNGARHAALAYVQVLRYEQLVSSALTQKCMKVMRKRKDSRQIWKYAWQRKTYITQNFLYKVVKITTNEKDLAYL